MNSKFYVISEKGEVLDVEEYLSNRKGSSDFRSLIKNEVYGEIGKVKGEKPKYQKYAHKLGFSWEKNADIGFMSMDYKANLMHRIVKEYARQAVLNIGLPIYEISGSRMFDMSHPVVQAYASLYGERLFQPSIGDKKMVMSYDCSYPQFNLAEKYNLSYRQLPFAHFSIGECFGLEQSGECMLFYRGRQFNMPDLHPYFKNIEEAFSWYPKIEQQIDKVFKEAKRNYEIAIVVSSQKYWDEYRKKIIEIAVRNKRDILIEVPIKDKNAYWILIVTIR